MVADTYKPKILFSCPEGWLDSPDGCFYFPTDVWAMNWEEAVGYCQELGGYLAEVLNDETQRFLVEQATSLGTSTNWWLGATDKRSVSFFAFWYQLINHIQQGFLNQVCFKLEKYIKNKLLSFLF